MRCATLSAGYVVNKWKLDNSLLQDFEQEEPYVVHTYAPMAKWNFVRLLLTMIALHDWHTKKLDYVAEFP